MRKHLGNVMRAIEDRKIHSVFLLNVALLALMKHPPNSIEA